MNGAIGSYIYAASLGSQAAQSLVAAVFCNDFQTPAGWNKMLDNMPARMVDGLLNRHGAWWTRQCFQALYVTCWIHHPVEKGSYMIQLPTAQYANVKDAYLQLLKSGGLQARISSHLSKKGASAHEGWHFLKGYEELLVQVEGEASSAPFLFLKCEGHALDGGLSLSTIQHGASWVVKEITGAGVTASEALNRWATFSATVESRAAENFSNDYKKLLKQLGLSSTTTTVDQVVDALARSAGLGPGIPDNLKRNTTALGNAMLGFHGYIAVFRRQAGVLKHHGVDFDDNVERELRGLAERMTQTPTAHQAQHYNEIRVTPADLNASLAAFRQFVP